MPYQEKPQFPQVEQAGAGERVTLENVKITFVFDLAQGSGWTRQDFKFESADGQHECKGKYWRPEKILSTGQVVTVVGGVEEYQGKKSVSIDAKKGGGIASEGEPLATVTPTAPQGVAPTPSQHLSVLNLTDYRGIIERAMIHWLETWQPELESGKLEYAEAFTNARTLAVSEAIAILRKDIDNSELPF